MTDNNRTYYSKTKKISSVIDHISKEHLKKGGYYYASLLLDWPKIVGDQVANYTYPLRISMSQDKKKTLLLQVEPAAALMVGFQKGLIIEKISAFFGKTIVEEIKLKQEPLKRIILTKKEKVVPTPTEEAKKSVEGIQDENLRNALLSLSCYIKD